MLERKWFKIQTHNLNQSLQKNSENDSQKTKDKEMQ